MKRKHLIQIGTVALAILALTSVAWVDPLEPTQTKNLVETVRESTAAFKDVQAAKDAGYSLFYGCVTGPQDGAMGIHFVNSDFVGDGELDAQHPEALLYQPKNGKLELMGAEYVVFADDWSANHDTPPVMMGQLFSYSGSPNRYGIPAYYELHVWAWESNPNGVFADWNPRVSCENYTGNIETAGAAQ